MARRRRKNYDEEPDGLSIAFGLAFLIVGYFGFTYMVDKNKFWYEVTHYLLPVVLVLFGLLFLYFVYLKRKQDKLTEAFEKRIENIETAGLEPVIQSYIERFGKEGKTKGWNHRNYSFDWTRLKDFKDELVHKNIKFADDGDFRETLKYFIDKKEKQYLVAGTNSNQKSANAFSDLNKAGSDLELLIVRLYDAMGYASKRIGGAGDQGADVIASKNGENVLIQAKSYTNAVNNEAVQQAHAALAFYGCSRAVVITTATFTSGAYDLARANNVELVDGELLKRKLHEHLGEIWV